MSEMIPPNLCSNYLDEICEGGDCTSFKFAIGDCGCGSSSSASGCDGQICVMGTGNPPDCLCDQPSFNFYKIDIVPLSSGAAGGGSKNLNCEGKATYDVSTCGTYLWKHIIPPVDVFAFCYEDSSGTFTYSYNGSPGSCNRDVPIYINTKNHWCGTPWVTSTSASDVEVSVEELSDRSSHILIEYPDGHGSCKDPPEPDRLRGGSADKDFCISCDYCEYFVTVTVCNGSSDPVATITLPGSHNAPSVFGPTHTPPFESCELLCKTSNFSGIVQRGKHQIDLDFQSIRNPVPAGANLDFTIKWGNCWNDCDLCICSKLEDDSMSFHWNDSCSGLNLHSIAENGSLSKTHDCLWESSCIETSGDTKRCTKFALICRDGCCHPPSGFPFHPKNLTTDTDNIYLYEFFNDNCDACSGVDWDSDYYIWKKQNNCNPLRFERVWEKCEAYGGTIPTCEHSFNLYTECLSGTPCANCQFYVSVHGEDNHLPTGGRYSLFNSGNFKILDGDIDEEGRVFFDLPSGNAPWYFLFEGNDCYNAVSGLVDCDGGSFFASTSDLCVVHSGACTLCKGAPIKKELFLTNNFGEVVFNWNGSAWEGSSCVQVDGCYSDEDGNCVNATGYVSASYSLSCYNDDFRLIAALPHRDCVCATGCDCGTKFIPAYSDSACSISISRSGDCTTTTNIFNFYGSSGNIIWDCDPFSLEIHSNIHNDTGCSDYDYDGTMTE